MVKTRFFAKLSASIVVGLFAAIGITPFVGTSFAAVSCSDISVTVSLSGQSGPIAGTLCSPPDARTVQLLVPGYTYDRSYWDFPYQSDRYSYVDKVNSAGYATLAIDRLGTGASWKPIGLAVDYQNSAEAVHRVVQALRDGSLGTQYQKVILVGHSYGSFVSYLEAGTYGDVDALISTGASHLPNIVNLATNLVTAVIPAILDPKFADSGLDPTYITTRVGTRGIFYNKSNADPAVIAKDEQLKAVSTLIDMGTVLPSIIINNSKNINIPVLTVIGSADQLFCGLLATDCSSSQAVANFERPYYGSGAIVEGYIVPNSGHDVNLEFTAPQAYTRMLNFADQHIGISRN